MTIRSEDPNVLNDFFLDMQNDIEVRELKARMSKEISDIRPFQSA